MRIVIGVTPDDSAADAVALGALLATLLDGSIVLAYVHPPTMDYPSAGRVDAEWAAYLRERGDDALDRAAAQLQLDWGISQAERATVANASVSHGLRGLAEHLEAEVTVLGAGTNGRPGYVDLGSIANSLVHGGLSAVALAPDGFRDTAPAAIERLVVGFRSTTEAHEVALKAVSMAKANEVAVHLLTMVLRTTRIIGSRTGPDPERAVMEALAESERAAQARVTAEVAEPVTGEPVTGEVVLADSPAEAMSAFSWRPGDVLVMASSRLGALRRVFMSDIAHKLLREATVPVLVMPRQATD